MIRKVGNTDILPVHRASCHCGAVVLELTLPDGIVNPRRCNCSICRMRGAVIVTAPLAALRITQGEAVLTRYAFNTGTAPHYFCSRCGIYTHHQRRTDPTHYAINVACLEGVSPFDFTALDVLNGVQHSNDTGRPMAIAGVLKYEAAANPE